ncbi:hypothetical protein NMY22_g5740 [Coprinellus aureogranulatus]|nr:hypothetical protein NMY22_g5740 [Coprinellus aureogranulatus]
MPIEVPELGMRLLDVTEEDPYDGVPEKDGRLVELVVDMTQDNDDSSDDGMAFDNDSDSDYIPTSEPDEEEMC